MRRVDLGDGQQVGLPSPAPEHGQPRQHGLRLGPQPAQREAQADLQRLVARLALAGGEAGQQRVELGDQRVHVGRVAQGRQRELDGERVAAQEVHEAAQGFARRPGQAQLPQDRRGEVQRVDRVQPGQLHAPRAAAGLEGGVGEGGVAGGEEEAGGVTRNA